MIYTDFRIFSVTGSPRIIEIATADIMSVVLNSSGSLKDYARGSFPFEYVRPELVPHLGTRQQRSCHILVLATAV